MTTGLWRRRKLLDLVYYTLEVHGTDPVKALFKYENTDL